MKERGMIFNTEMVKAIREGRKTQTRRPMKIQPPNNLYTLSTQIGDRSSKNNGKMHWIKLSVDRLLVEKSDNKFFKCPYGKIGDRIYVRETFTEAWTGDIIYKADWGKYDIDWDSINGSWRPSIHMPKKYAKTWLEITNIRIERVQNISEDDAKKEGMMFLCRDKYNSQDIYGFSDDNNNIKAPNAYTAFYNIWNSIYNNWNNNPWVWVVDFN